jgi:hypothetical protein
MISLFLIARHHDSPMFDLIWGTTLVSLVVVSIFWNCTGSRKYEQWRAQNWPVASGKFNEGEIITMLKGRSKDIAGYVVRIDYCYVSGQSYDGVYFTKEFPTHEAAEEYLNRLENQSISVRISPNKSHQSQILDSDLVGLLPPR